MARAVGVILSITAALAIVTIAFALPAARSGPHDLPIGAAGPQAAGGRVAAMLDEKAPGAFAVTYYPGADALADAIRNREVYGGLVLPAQPDQQPTLLIASGASPAVAQLLTQIAGRTPTPLRIDDLAPPTARDPRGAGIAASALPITLAGLLPAIALLLLLPTEHGIRFAAAMVFAGAAGLTIAALLRYVLGSIDQNFWAVAAGLSLGVAAALVFVLGLGALFGRAGLAVGALLALLVGNPLSGLASAPQMLPAPWGEVGQWLPQGATATLLRSTAAFGGAGASMAIVVLVVWLAAGSALVVTAAVRHRKPAAM
ncbi:hypothetical protein ASG82_14795 [Mycobacterium sp. Soil538]|nr:hypothetical protein ASG82_14795 [Mycobacterium sp. Soil538]